MLLVHSPLLTSATWDALRPQLETAGWTVAVPDFRPMIDASSYHTAVCAAVAAIVAADARTVLVGHSRAGAYLPGIADAIGRDSLDIVFMDARLPHPGLSWVGSLPPERATWLRQMAVSGRLPTWDTWFPADSIDALMPDPVQRRQVLGGLPQLPWKLVDEVLPASGTAWISARRIYLQLSAEYKPTADRAAQLGYRVRRRDADHLAMVTQPTMVADLLLSALQA
jgi:hypothetical protein